MNKNKNAIALMITLAIIAIITQIVYLTFIYLEKTSKSSNEIKNIIQANINIKNLEPLINALTKDINSSEDMSLLYDVPLIFELENNTSIINITLTPNSNVININNLIDIKNEINETYRGIFDNIFLTNTIDNPHLLMDYILDAIDKDDTSRSYQSEIKMINPLFSDGGIMNMKHFRQILNFYYDNTDDEKIFLIPWEEFIGFNNKDIDFNFISPNLLSKIDSSISEIESKRILDGETFYTQLEEINLENDTIKIFKKFPMVFFNLSFHCQGLFSNNSEVVEFAFDYDKKNKVTKFEIIN